MEALSVDQNLSLVDIILLFSNVHQFQFQTVWRMDLWTLTGILDIVEVRNCLMVFDPLFLMGEKSRGKSPAHEFHKLVSVFAKVLNYFFVVKQVIAWVRIGLGFDLLLLVVGDSNRWVHQDGCWLHNIHL